MGLASNCIYVTFFHSILLQWISCQDKNETLAYSYVATSKVHRAGAVCTPGNGDRAHIESVPGLTANDLRYYSNWLPGKTQLPQQPDVDWCDYHMRLYGEDTPLSNGKYLHFADTHMDWNDKDCKTISCKAYAGLAGQPNQIPGYARFYGWQEDAAKYIEQLFKKVGHPAGVTVAVQRHWYQLGNALGPRTQQHEATCHSPTVYQVAGNAPASVSNTPGHHFWGGTGDGTTTASLSIYCEQSNGWADLIELN